LSSPKTHDHGGGPKYIDRSMRELYNWAMEIISDASAFLAVALNEIDRDWVIGRTSGCTVIAPEVLPYEIGNALIAIRKRGRLTDRDILRAFDISARIAVRLVPVKIPDALKIAIRFNIYAYDAYYLQCCVETQLPLISLDERMCGIARRLGIKVVE
jgi:predicted nucleic acid-binding protein